MGLENTSMGGEQLTAAETRYFETGGNTDPAAADAAPDQGTPADGAPPSDAAPADAPPPGGGGATRQATVPHAALHEERESHKATKREFAALQERYNTLAQRADAILARFAQPPEQARAAPALPDPKDDPFGYLNEQVQRLGKTVEQLTAGQEQNRQQQTEQQRLADIGQQATALEREFAAKTPDYVQAVTFLRTSRANELAALGVAQPEIVRALNQEAAAIAISALNAGKNPAEVAYQLASLRGYRKPEAAAAAPNGAAVNTTQQEGQDMQRTNEDRLRQVQSGQRQAQSIGQLRGGARAPLTAQRLLEMSDAEFDAAMQTPEGRALMGV